MIDEKKLWKWMHSNFSFVWDKKCLSCEWNKRKIHKFIRYLNKLSNEAKE